MSKFSRGPWTISRSKKGNYQHLSSYDWESFAKVVVRFKLSDRDDSMGLANLRLIQSAPELFNALQNLRSVCYEMSGTISLLDKDKLFLGRFYDTNLEGGYKTPENIFSKVDDVLKKIENDK
jgi:hypothetical protein